MSACKETRDRLDAYTVGLEDLDALGSRHIQECAECSVALREAQELHHVLMAYAGDIDREAEYILTHRANRDWQPRSAELPPTRFTRRWLVPLFGVAAMLALFAMITVLRDRPSPAPTGQRLYVQALERVSTEGEIMNYLDRSQALVLTLMDGTPTCGDGRIQIGAEKELARDLIYQKKLLDVQLTRPMHQDFKTLCDDLEILLLDVAVSDSCVSLETLQLWQHALESRSMLMKMNLLRMEGRI